MRLRVGGIVLFTLAAAAAPMSAQEGGSPWDRYVPGRLQAVIDAHAAVIAENPSADSVLAISAEDFPTRATLTYAGESRPLPTQKRDFLVKWLRSMGQDSTLASKYSTELRFREGETSFWLPVQDGMPEWAKANLKPGDVATVFVIFLGARRIHGQPEWMFFATGL